MDEPSEPDLLGTQDERRQLHAVNAAAERFFRRELLRATGGWAPKYLRDRGVASVLTPGSAWKVGYAPEGWTRLTEHLQGQGFRVPTMHKAGLIEWAANDTAIDRYRDQLILVSRDQAMAPVGFIGIDQHGQTRALTPTTPVHRPSNALVGLAEQADLLQDGATPVIVDHPVDAIAVEQLSRSTTKQYVGIPLCESPISTAQARMLRRHSETDRVIVAIPAEIEGRRRAVGCALDLAFFFDRIRSLRLPVGETLSTLSQSSMSRDQLLEYLSSAKRLVGHHYGPHDIGNHHTSLGLGDPGPSL